MWEIFWNVEDINLLNFVLHFVGQLFGICVVLSTKMDLVQICIGDNCLNITAWKEKKLGIIYMEDVKYP